MRVKLLARDHFGLICFIIFVTLSVMVAFVGGNGWAVSLPPFVGVGVIFLRQILWPPRKRILDFSAIFFLLLWGITAFV